MKQFFLFTSLICLLATSTINAQDKAQKKVLKKFAKTYKLGKIQDDIFSIQDKKSKLYGLASTDGNIITPPKFAWISNQNKAGHYITAMQRSSSNNDGGGSFLLGLTDLNIYDSQGKIVNVDGLKNMELQFRGGGEYNEEYLRTIKNSLGKFGLIDGSGKFLVAPAYDFVGSPNENGLGYLFDKKKYGIYDLSQNIFDDLEHTPPTKDNETKQGNYYKDILQKALSWTIKHNSIMTSSDGINFGLLDYSTKEVIFPEKYGYDFEQMEYNYVEAEEIKKSFVLKAKNTNTVALYDGLTKKIFFDETFGFDDVFFFQPTDEKEWVHVSRGYEKNLFNLN